jgi:hypothetical protein
MIEEILLKYETEYPTSIPPNELQSLAFMIYCGIGIVTILEFGYSIRNRLSHIVHLLSSFIREISCYIDRYSYLFGMCTHILYMYMLSNVTNKINSFPFITSFFLDCPSCNQQMCVVQIET